MTHRLVRGRGGVGGDDDRLARGRVWGGGGGEVTRIRKVERERACGVLSKVCLVHSLHVIVYAI